MYNAIVWQCGRAASITRRIEDKADTVRAITGLALSPYFSAAKFAWILENVEGTADMAKADASAAGL